MSQPTKSPPAVRTPLELGQLVRDHRKRASITLQDVSDISRLGTRFLSEMERGKENVSLGKTLQALQALGLEMIVLPRADAARLSLRSDPSGDQA